MSCSMVTVLLHALIHSKRKLKRGSLIHSERGQLPKISFHLPGGKNMNMHEAANVQSSLLPYSFW